MVMVVSVSLCSCPNVTQPCRDTRVSQTREPREQFRVPRQLEAVTR